VAKSGEDTRVRANTVLRKKKKRRPMRRIRSDIATKSLETGGERTASREKKTIRPPILFRETMENLLTGGPSSLSPQDNSRFLEAAGIPSVVNVKDAKIARVTTGQNKGTKGQTKNGFSFTNRLP